MKFDFVALNSRKKIVVILALLTGTLHLFYGLYGVFNTFPRIGIFDLLFIANMIGNLVLVTLLYFSPMMNPYHQWVKGFFVLFTLSSIVAYIITYLPGGLRVLLFPPGVFDKFLEILLVFFLLLDRPLDSSPRLRNVTTA